MFEYPQTFAKQRIKKGQSVVTHPVKIAYENALSESGVINFGKGNY